MYITCNFLFSTPCLWVKKAKTTTTTINQINDVDFVGTYFKQCKTSHQKVNNRLLTVMLAEDSLRFVIWLTYYHGRKLSCFFSSSWHVLRIIRIFCLSFTNTYEIFYIYLSTVRQLHVISVMGRFRQRDAEWERKSARKWIMNATSGAQFAATPLVNSVCRSSPAVFTVSSLFLL